MCCRYTLKRLTVAELFRAELADRLAADDPARTPRFNVALTSRMPVITRRPAATLEAMHFGFLLPARPAAPKPVIVANARAESLLDKPAFRDAAQHRRCLVPADGFFEWEKKGADRLPHYFTLKDGQPFFFAGLWEPARDDHPATFCIVTTRPNALLEPIHDRMPVLLGPNSGPAWLGDTPLRPAQLTQLCRPLRADLMTGYRVSPRVNNVRYEASDCIAPL